MSAALSVAAPAKVNLFLRILARDDGGFHQIETLLATLDFADELVLERSPGGVVLHVEGPAPTDPRENLAGRAAFAFFRAAGIDEGVTLHLEKRLPSGAGLGGGSSDAGATLRGLNRLFGEPLTLDALMRVGAELGSDVPFFVAGAPLALAWGRGERLLQLPPLPPAPALVLAPDFTIRTKDAYAAVAKARGARACASEGRALDLDTLASWEGVARLAENDFEPVLLGSHPALARPLGVLRRSRALFALLSGSGSALFAIYSREEERAAAMETLAAEGVGTIVAATTLHSVPDVAPVRSDSDGSDSVDPLLKPR